MGRERHAVTRAGDDTPQGNPRPASLQEQKAPLLRCGRKNCEDTRANKIEQQVGLGLLAEDTELREGKPAQDHGSADNLQSFAHKYLLRSFTTVFLCVVFACRVRRTPRPGEPQKVAPCCASSASGYLMMDSRLTMISPGRGEKIIGCHDHLDKHTTLHHPALCAAFHHLDSYRIGS
jgi:hypothetical protein